VPNMFSDWKSNLRPCYRVDFQGAARAITEVVEESSFVYIFG